MTCSDVERVLPELMGDAPEGGIETDFANHDFANHLQSCPACSELVSDLRLIASEARKLEATEEPAPRVWVQIAAQLRAEGLIRDPEFEQTSATARPLLAPASRERKSSWSMWWLAPVAAALLAAGSYVISHKPAPQVAQQQTPVAPTPLTTSALPPVQPVPVAKPPAVDHPSPSVAPPAGSQVARKSDTIKRSVEPGPSAEDQEFLSVVSTRAPSMRAAYENQLQAVNNFIRESQAYLDRNPGDADARQHLMEAYQQKALLYQIALDRIQ